MFLNARKPYKYRIITALDGDEPVCLRYVLHDHMQPLSASWAGTLCMFNTNSATNNKTQAANYVYLGLHIWLIIRRCSFCYKCDIPKIPNNPNKDL